jgi:hypothetical protein
MPGKRNEVERSAADREIAFTRVTTALVFVLIILFGITTPLMEDQSIRISICGLGGGVASTRGEGECAEGREVIRASPTMPHVFDVPMVWTDPKQVALRWGSKGFTATIERGRPVPQFEMMATFAEEGKTRLTMRMIFLPAEGSDQSVGE